MSKTLSVISDRVSTSVSHIGAVTLEKSTNDHSNNTTFCLDYSTIDRSQRDVTAP